MEFERKLGIANFIIAVLGLLIAIMAMAISYKAIKSNELIAEKSGAFDKPYLILGIGNFMITNPRDTISLIYGCSWENNTLSTATLPFNVSNTGEKDAENIKISFNTPKGFFLNDSLVKLNSNLIVEAWRKSLSEKKMDFISYDIPLISPGLKVDIEELFIFNRTSITDTISITTIDDHIANLQYNIDYSVLCTASVINKDNKPSQAIFSISCIDASNINDLIDKSIEQINSKKSKGFYTFIIYPELEESIQVDNYKINTYKTTSDAIKFALVKDIFADESFLVSIYSNDNNLEQVRLYDHNNKYIKNIMMSNN